MAESRTQHDIRLALGLEDDLVLWRNAAGAIRDDKGKIVGKFGLVVGACDTIGIQTLPVRLLPPETIIGRFFALEIKTHAKWSKPEPEQERFINLVRARGGFAAIGRDVDEARAALERARKGERA